MHEPGVGGDHGHRGREVQRQLDVGEQAGGRGRGDVRGGLRAVGRARARPAERAHHAGGLPLHCVRGRVQLRGRTGVGARVAHSGRYPAETVFFRGSLPVIDISIGDLHNGGGLNAYGMCFLQQNNLNLFTILQTQNRSTQ